MLLPIVRNEINKFTVVKIHYTADPDKAKPEWKAETKAGMTDRGWNREYEIDYTSFAGKPYFPEFNNYNIAKAPITYKSREMLYRGWDYGFHRPCALITKLNEIDQWCWVKAILGKDEGVRDFGIRVKRFCEATYPGGQWIDADDIAGKQKSDKSDKTSREILNNLGIFPQSRKQEIREGGEIIRQKIAIRVDGQPGLLVDPRETNIIDGFNGGIHYPEPREGQPDKEFYEKDGFYDHIFDAARYLGVEMFTIIGQTQTQNELTVDPMKQKYAMGRPVGNDNEVEDTGTIRDYF